MSPDHFGFAPRPKDPERDKNRNKATNVEAEDEALHKREVFGEDGVEERDEEDDGDGDKGAVPSFVNVGGIVEDY